MRWTLFPGEEKMGAPNDTGINKRLGDGIKWGLIYKICWRRNPKKKPSELV